MIMILLRQFFEKEPPYQTNRNSDENSASASEITSGSLQDLDRAVVVGTRTYGKGLVQLPNLPLPYNGNLKVTTSKYYIPSGRCIQAINYKHNKEGQGGSKYGERTPDSLANVFHTVGGREPIILPLREETLRR